VGLHLYCIAPAGHRPPAGLAGVDGAGVAGVEAGRLVAWVSDAAERTNPTLDRVRAHHAVVESAQSDDLVPLPVRFGQWFRDAAPLEAALRDRETEHLSRLEALRGTAEFGLRIAGPARRAARDVRDRSAASGAAYLRAAARRVAEEREEAALLRPGLDDAREAVRDLVREELTDETAPGLAGLLHLVPRAHWGSYRARLGELQARHPDLRFMISGPWPPYSFAG
jgi:hypothetical protein